MSVTRVAPGGDGVLESAGVVHVATAGVLDASHRVILYLEGITVSFDGFRALNELTLYVEIGELRCIIGPNGAGKTTMMDVVTGKTRPDSGTAFFGQTMDLTRMSEAEITSKAERVASACTGNPRMSLKSVSPLLPPNPISLRKNASSSA